jgi:MFS family permease
MRRVELPGADPAAMPALRRWADQTFGALAIPAFRTLWIGTLTSFLAFFMSTVVNSVVAFQLTGANRAVGTVIFSQGIAMFLLGPLGGALADRWPKRRVVAVGQSTTGAVFTGLGLLAAGGSLTITHLALGSLAIGTCFAFIGPARQALVGELVDLERRGNAMALSLIANNASRVGGPAVAGVLLAWDAAGPSAAYFTMGALYVLAAASLVLLPRSRGRDERTSRVLADVADGLRYVRGQPTLRMLLLQFLAVIMVGFPYVTVMPGLVENRLGRGAEAISLLAGTAAAGGLLTSVLVARFADTARSRAVTSTLGLAFSLALLVIAVAPTFRLAALASFAVGAASGGYQTLASAVMLRTTDPGYLGRVMSLTMMAFAGFGVMGLPIGWLADAVGERGALAAMGLAVALAVVITNAALVRLEAAPTQMPTS